MGSLEARARSASRKLDEIRGAIEELAAQGLPGAQALDFGVDVELSRIDTARNLRVTGGRPGFAD